MQASLLGDLQALATAAADLQSAAPTPTGRGWDATMDRAAIDAMKAAWTRARAAYEHVEGAVAPIFPDLDLAIDDRYDGFLGDLKGKGDQDLFDGEGVTGMHAVERILFADSTPAKVVAFEKSLPGYKAAAFPATAEEAADFKSKLCARLVADARTLVTQWTPQKIDVSGAFQGLVGLMNEQQEKIDKASSGEEESRYAQRTMSDLRANLEGTRKIYALFHDWLVTRANAQDPARTGAAVDARIAAAFTALGQLYGQVPGDAIPTPPETWSEMPSPADLQSPFGRLYTAVAEAVDPKRPESLVGQLNDAARLLGLPAFTVTDDAGRAPLR